MSSQFCDAVVTTCVCVGQSKPLRELWSSGYGHDPEVVSLNHYDYMDIFYIDLMEKIVMPIEKDQK